MLVSRDGWVKRQKEVKDLATTRLREGDAVLAVAAGQHARDGRVLHATSASPTPRASPTSRRRPATASRSSGSSSSRTASGSSRRSAWIRAWRRRSRGDEGGRRRRRCTPSPSRATATACASASSRSSSRARAPGRRYARPAEGAEVVGVAQVDRRGDPDRGDARGARACCARRTRSTSSRARAAASS